MLRHTRRVRDHRDRLIESPDRLGRGLLLLAPATALAAVPAAAILMPSASVLTWLLVAGGLAGGVLVAGLISLVSKPVELADTRALTRQHRCGCCRYQLRDLPVDPDGCTVCPECGGAWKLRLANSRDRV